MSQPLIGKTVLVTRPAHQTAQLCTLIEAAGGQVVRFPVIEIIPLNKLALEACHLSQFDSAIFISANAVHHALPTLLNTLPHNLQVMAVGKQTAKALQAYEINALFPPAPFNSEMLLSMPECQTVKNKKIIIFRGQRGRELLADTLRQRGATVSYLDVYQRAIPTSFTVPSTPIDAITITSIESAKNLFHMLTDNSWLNIPFVVLSQRIADYLPSLGVQSHIAVAPFASDEGLIMALKDIAGKI